jgi:hypothetical protein
MGSGAKKADAGRQAAESAPPAVGSPAGCKKHHVPVHEGDEIVSHTERLIGNLTLSAVSAEHGKAADRGTVRNFVHGRAVEHFCLRPCGLKAVREGPKGANCDFAIAHSLGGISHSFSDRFKIR